MLSLQEIDEIAANRNKATREAYATGAHRQGEIGEYYGSHPSTVGVIVLKKRNS